MKILPARGKQRVPITLDFDEARVVGFAEIDRAAMPDGWAFSRVGVMVRDSRLVEISFLSSSPLPDLSPVGLGLGALDK